ncbi:MAG: hypothetical protein JWQ34_729 [Mucilaginibacter sp.]|uniref:DUF4961 domain-containing protein n=1 Tax=Mucilaginibacter sp. TaxID=1882438 RepID=UPI002627A35F|nr:DUF4961 domain-containing protein [Mucilaginibacter sp.]MDB5002504.1 hypothetical protein [Mucilaginibacter sp.]
MKTRLRIKGKKLWLLCAVVLLGISLSCCYLIINSVNQPASAVVGSTVSITVNATSHTNSSGTAHMIFGILAPKGWNLSKNAKVTYTSSKGNGNMTLIPAAIINNHAGGLSWAAYMKSFFGLEGNLIDDMEWIPFQSDAIITYANGDLMTVAINIQITNIGADNNPTLVKLAYVIANDVNAFTFDGNDGDSSPTSEYYNEFTTPCFSLTGGTGDLVDFCNPQLTTIDPPKSLDNDIVTLTYNNNIVSTPLGTNAANPAVYICATATTSDGKTLNACTPGPKTMMTQTSAGSGVYQITFWPKALFGATTGQSIVSMTYYITNQAGTIQVGYGNTAAAFTYKFKCL